MFSTLVLLLFTVAVVIVCLSTVPMPELYPSFAFLALLVAVFVFYTKEFINSLKKNKFDLMGVFLAFYFISMWIARGMSVSVGLTVYMIMSVSPILLYDVYAKRSRFFIGVLLLIVTIVLIVDSIYGFELMAFLGDRGLKDSVLQEYEDKFLRNGFYLVYSLVISIPVFIMILTKKRYYPKNFFLRIIFFVVFAALIAYFSFFIFKASFTTALVLTIGFGVLSLLPEKKNILPIALVTSVFFIIVFLLSYDTIINSLKKDDTADRMLAPRVEEIHDVLTGRAHEAEDMGERKNLTFSSLQTFIFNPLFGVTWESKSFEYEETVLGVGHHSEWFDMLARFGLFAFLLISYTARALKRHYEDTGQKLYIILYIVLGFLNPMYNLFMNFITFCYVPLLFVFFLGNKSPLLSNEKKYSKISMSHLRQ